VRLHLRLGSSIAMLVFVSNCGDAQSSSPSSARSSALSSSDTATPPYTGVDERGIPHYAHPKLSDDDRQLLRRVYGVEDPGRLYVSDSSEDGLLKYDTKIKRCQTCYVNSYRIGFHSIRRPGETWEELERRVHNMRLVDFPPSARVATTTTRALDPDVSARFDGLLAEGRRLGFVLHVADTYRSPEREAYLMWRGGGRTHTLTSLHSYGRAIDVVVGDGNTRHAKTRERWIAFRRWVTSYDGHDFRVLGTPERTWDWGHIELPTSNVGLPTIEAAIARARRCQSGPNTGEVSCDFAPHLAQRVSIGLSP
jgi:hypothetical protein